MAAYLSRRLASGVLLILALTLLTYVVFFTIPTNPACNVLDCGPQNHTTPAEFAAAKHALGLDRSFLHQYGDFLWNLVRHGSFGTSFAQQQPIGAALESTIPATASILLGGAILLVLLALPLGAISALRPHGLLDRGVLVLSLVGIALHPFVLGILLQKLSYRLGIGPPFAGYCPLHGHTASSGFAFAGAGCGGPLDWAFSLYLPWIVFALFFLPLYTRMFRARTLAVLGEPYVRTARAKGASQLRVLSRHVLRNAALPILPMLAMDVGTAITTAIYIEVIFRINGLGRFAVDALSGNGGGYDLPSIVGIVFVVACAVVVLNLLADVALVVLDPRITGRSGSRSGWRREDGRLNRRRLAVAVAVGALAAGSVAAGATIPRGGGRASVMTYTAGAKPIPDHWTDHLRFGGFQTIIVDVERIVVGPSGWAVTARIEDPGGQDLTVLPGHGNYPPQAGFSLQFASKDKISGRPIYTALPAVAYDPPLPAKLPLGRAWEGTFAGPGKPPHDGTMISVGLGLFSTVTDPGPKTLVTNSSFKLH